MKVGVEEFRVQSLLFWGLISYARPSFTPPFEPSDFYASDLEACVIG